MRKLISTILVLCMVLCLLPVTAAADDANPAEPAETVKLDVGAKMGKMRNIRSWMMPSISARMAWFMS